MRNKTRTIHFHGYYIYLFQKQISVCPIVLNGHCLDIYITSLVIFYMNYEINYVT